MEDKWGSPPKWASGSFAGCQLFQRDEDWRGLSCSLNRDVSPGAPGTLTGSHWLGRIIKFSQHFFLQIWRSGWCSLDPSPELVILAQRSVGHCLDEQLIKLLINTAD